MTVTKVDVVGDSSKISAWSVRTIVSLAFVLLNICNCRQIETTQPPDIGKTEFSQTKPVSHLDYVEMRTANTLVDQELPMIVAVHGLGDRPEHFKSLLGNFSLPARVILPRAPIPFGPGFAWFTTRISENQPKKLSNGIARAAKQVASLISHLKRIRPTKGQPILCGFSQGGMVAYAVALSHPETIRLSIPISGLLPKPMWPKTKTKGRRYPPIRALHGNADRVVSIDPARQLVDHLAKLGFDAILTTYPRVPHTVTFQMNQRLEELIKQIINKKAVTTQKKP